jgi:hypothetical protein
MERDPYLQNEHIKKYNIKGKVEKLKAKIVVKGFEQLRGLGSQPYFWKSGKMTLTLPKWGLGSPSGLSKLQSLIAGVKTPYIEVFFISLKSYRSVDVENGLS